MACKNICKLCDRLVLSTAVAYNAADNTLRITLPAGSYADGEKYCIVVAQEIPAETTINALVEILIGTGTELYPLTTKCCEQVIARAIRTRTKYSTHVVTTPVTGAFRLIGDLCQCTDDTRPYIDGT